MRVKRGHQLAILALLLISGAVFSRSAFASYGDVTTFLGKVYTGDGGSARQAWLDFPEDVNYDAAGNLYVADTGNNVIRKIGTDGKISTYAGSGHYGMYNAAGTSAQFASPKGLAVDSSGNLFIADTDNSMIRKVDTYRGVSTVVGTTLKKPEGVAVYGSILYIADTGNNLIKKLNLGTGRIDVLTADVKAPKKLVVSGNGSTLYVADTGNYRVVAVNTTSGATSLVAGGRNGYAEGVGSAAKFQHLYGIALNGDKLYVTDGNGFDDRIRKIDLDTRTTTLLVRDLRMRMINYPAGLRIRGSKVVIANSGISTIQAFDKVTGDDVNADFIAGKERYGYRNGSFSNALFGRPSAVVQSPDRTKLYVADNNKIRKIDLDSKQVSLVAGSSIDDYIGEDEVGVDARFSGISSMAISPNGETLYVVDRWNNRIRGVTIASGATFLVAGGGDFNTSGPGNGYVDGSGDAARFDNPFGIAISPNGETLYVSDTANRRIRKISIASGQTSLIAGSGANGYLDGVKGNAKFRYPAGLTIDTAGSHLYVADRDSNTIRKIRISDGVVTTIVGRDGTPGYRDAIGGRSVLALPVHVTYGSDKRLYFSDAGSHRIRLVELASNVTKLVAGSGNRGYHDSARFDAKFNGLGGLAVDTAAKVLFAADANNDLIRRVSIIGDPPYTDAAPVVQGVLPGKLRSESNPAAVAYLDVVGGNYLYGDSTKFGDYATTTYGKSSSALTVVIPIGQMETGWYDVEVRHLDGQHDVLENAFAVTDRSGAVPDRLHQIIETDGWLAYGPNFTGGVNLAAGDVNKDGKAEIITAPAENGSADVRVYSSTGRLRTQFFAYDSNTRMGLSLASCDLNNDGRAEILTGPSAGFPAEVKIFSPKGKFLRNFYAFPRSSRVGASVACGDVTGDGKPEIVVAPRAKGGAHVRVFSSTGKLKSQFFAYPKDFRLGLDVAIGNVNGKGSAEIAVIPLTTSGPQVRFFTSKGRVVGQFYAYKSSTRGGFNLDLGDTDKDGRDEFVVGTENGLAPQVRVMNQKGRAEASFFAFSSRLRSGVHVAAGDVDGDGIDDIVAAPAKGQSTIRVFDGDGSPF
jgi:sugar lactone lactonase YvrE